MKNDTPDSGRQANPYDLLAAAGVTPTATMAEIRDASFELMAAGFMDHEAREAWDRLRKIKSRLWIDFGLGLLSEAPDFRGLADYFEEGLRGLDQPADLSEMKRIEFENLDFILKKPSPIHCKNLEIRPLPSFDDERPKPAGAALIPEL